MKVSFFPGCMVDMFYPEVGIAAVNVLERLGCELELPEKQVCCGQGLVNSGYASKSAHVARYILDAYDESDDLIVSLTGSCMNAIVNDYPALLADDPVYTEKQKRVSARFYEFTDFIVNYLGVTDVGASFHHTVTYHASCHLTRFLGVEEAPLALLRVRRDLLVQGTGDFR
ncbi:MAG: (Fe-S)-binding protein [Coriobacteriales bacterium]|jgi:L-lactate dehydrogenase complex protein LldE